MSADLFLELGGNAAEQFQRQKDAVFVLILKEKTEQVYPYLLKRLGGVDAQNDIDALVEHAHVGSVDIVFELLIDPQNNLLQGIEGALLGKVKSSKKL